MIVTIHQPAYLPWLGYFDKIARSDIYVFLDTVQFEKGSFTNRNKIKLPNGATWLTIPVLAKGHLDSTMEKLAINHSSKWQKKHLRSIFSAYKKAPYFEERYPKLEALYAQEYHLLRDMCHDHLLFWLKELGITTKVVVASEIGITPKESDDGQSHKTELIVDLCRSQNADTYLSGALGKGYMDEGVVKKEDIRIIYQDYQHPIYPQLWGDFVPNMGIVDFWMNCDDFSLISNNE